MRLAFGRAGDVAPLPELLLVGEDGARAVAVLNAAGEAAPNPPCPWARLLGTDRQLEGDQERIARHRLCS